MTPDDGLPAGFSCGAAESLGAPAGEAGAVACSATLLPDGGCMLTFSGAAAAPPAIGLARWPIGESRWRAWSQRGDDGRWRGVALLDTLPDAPLTVSDGADDGSAGRPWAQLRLGRPTTLEVGPRRLAGLARAMGAEALGLARFLLEAAPDGPSPPPPAFVAELLSEIAEPAGFVEVVGGFDGGGLFLQGWRRAPLEGPMTVVILADRPVEAEAVAATFARDDLLAPATGALLVAHRASVEPSLVRGVCIAAPDGLVRLDATEGGPVIASRETAVEHIRALTRRLTCGPEALRAVRRACRPRFDGADTLSPTDQPIAAALDLLLRNDAGEVLAMGWLLDPDRRVERVLVKGERAGYAALHETWTRLPRPDLVTGFAADPRFAGRLDGAGTLHGFVARGAGLACASDARLYLELVLDDGGCLFLPLTAVRPDPDAPLPPALFDLRDAALDFKGVVRAHLAPFFGGVERPAPKPRGDCAAWLGDTAATAVVAAIAPVEDLGEAELLLAALAGAPEASTLDLTLVAERSVAGRTLESLRRAFAFYGVGGRLVAVEAGAGIAARLDAGWAAAPTLPFALAWSPAALPRSEDWLAQLIAAARGAGSPALVSPTLVHEDDSIRYAGGRLRRAGYARSAVGATSAASVEAGAAELALIDGALLRRAGGFGGRSFGDRLAHLDLARRVRAEEGVVLWTPQVEFWVAEPPEDPVPPPELALRRAIDAALLGGAADGELREGSR